MPLLLKWLAPKSPHVSTNRLTSTRGEGDMEGNNNGHEGDCFWPLPTLSLFAEERQPVILPATFSKK
jgi:hypothetical protein